MNLAGIHKIDRIAKETPKAWLVGMNGLEYWIPKSACHLDTEKNIIQIADWFAKNMDVSGALFSDDGKHRYQLYRTWNKFGKIALCVGLNPSTGNRSKNDPTIDRLSFTLSGLGYGGLRMVNLYTFISSDPKFLLSVDREKDLQLDMGLIFGNSLCCDDVIFCWGKFEEAKARALRVIEGFSKGLCFGVNQDGSPWHPLALMYAGFNHKKSSGNKPRLFTFRDHNYDLNVYNRKDFKKKMEHSQKQYQLPV